PYVVKQDDKSFGFLNIDIDGKILKGTFYANEYESDFNAESTNYILDDFIISKKNNPNNND
ncbi:MAG: hypothetical protein AB7F53_09210, partial [Nitrososphaeraceae archaeon]